MCAAIVRPPLARLIARAGRTALRPQPITASGQGGVRRRPDCVTPPDCVTASSGATHNDGAAQRHGGGTVSGFSTNGKPAASATPRAWLAMPALPSCRTQTIGGAPGGPASTGGAAGTAKDSATIGRVYGNIVPAASGPAAMRA